MFLKPVPKGPSRFPNVVLFRICLGTFKPVDCLTHLGDGVLILGEHQKVMDGIVSLEVSLHSHCITHLLKTYAKFLSIGCN